MFESTQSNSNVWETGDAHSTGSAINLNKIEVPRLNPYAKLEYHPLGDFKIQESLTKTELNILPKLKAESLPTNESNKPKMLLISRLVGPMDQKKALSKIKEKLVTNVNLSCVPSELSFPTTPTPASNRIEINDLNPVVVLERFPLPTTCLEMINADRSSTQVAGYVKNERENQIRNYGTPTVVTKFTRPTFSIGCENKKSVTTYSAKLVRSKRKTILFSEQCDKSLSVKSSLESHIITHTEEKQYTCCHCDKSFSQKNILERHMLTHTGERQYTCRQCDKSFSQKSNLKRHMLTHTGLGEYKCGECDKLFYLKNYLQTHMISHTGEKLNMCWQCGKSYSHNSTFKSHMISHTEEKTYVCEQCNKSFSRKSCLKRHMITHTKEMRYIIY